MSANTEDLKNDIVSRIRSCLISTKGQVTLRQLEADYRTLLGERIPYQKLGYKSLETFIQSVPTLVTSRGPNGELFVDAKISEKSAHISSMVRKQKSSGVKKRVRITAPPRINRFGGGGTAAPASHPPRFNAGVGGQQQTDNIQRWRPKKNPFLTNNKRPPVENSSRLAAVNHNQFISSPGYKKPKVPSKVVVPERAPKVQAEVRKPELKRSNSSPEKAENGVGNGSEWGSSPLSSAMRRISKIMNEISVERDSGNSSPTADYVAGFNKNQEIIEFVRTDDPIQDIRRFVDYHKLGNVEVKFTETKAKHSKLAHCHCKITVGKHMYSSYPDDFYDKTAAERHASQKALDDLVQKYSKRRSLLLSSNDDIIERIPPMLEKHNNAVWMWQIEADYIDKFSEQLPSDWLQIIDNSPHVLIENLKGGYVLKYCNPDDKGKRLDVSLNIGDISVPCNTVQFGENNRLFGIVTVARSVNEVWCNSVGTSESEKFTNMIREMVTFYEDNHMNLPPANVNYGSCYAVNTDQGWARVRAVTVPKDGIVDCFMLDFGDVARAPIDQVFALKREYAIFEAQAFVCRLSGLEDFDEISQESEQLQAITGGPHYVIEMAMDEMNENTEDVTIPVVLYESGSGISVNQELLSIFATETAVPVIDKTTITEVFVSNIEPNGDVYVQIRNPGFFHLMGTLHNLTEQLAKNPPFYEPPTKDSNRSDIYLVEEKITKKWLRAVIVDWSPRGDLAQIYYVDQGNTEVISVANKKMYPCEEIDPILGQYVPQALKVRIMIEKIPSDFVERARKLLEREQPVLLKVVSYDNENVPWVEFFKRTNDGVLVFINKTISVEEELLNFDCSSFSNNNNNENSKKRLMNFVQFGDSTKNVPSGGSLKKPDLPKIGDYFNVNIPFAVNPWNFFVQPLDSYKELLHLMADMQDYYNDLHYSPLQIEDIVPGKIYASRHDDGRWYRTSVLKVIHSGSISVFYCDFGYYTNLTLAQLIPLDIKYMNLPYQALKAKISGIKPVKNKWTMEDCDFFKNLVMKKCFVSILVNIEKDELYKSDLILQLLLIDTSSAEDVNIKDLLIQKGIAASA